MLRAAAHNWWVLVLQGVLGILFGIIALVSPDIALTSLALVLAAWAIVSGLSQLGEGFRVAEMRGRSWPFAVIGVASIVAGLIAAAVPGITILGLILVLGYWLIIAGVMEVYTAWRIRAEVTGEWVLALAGILRVVLGVIVVAAPTIGAILTVTWLAVAALFGGAMAIVLGLRLRGLGAGMSGGSRATTANA
ncbi:MAG TPA: DUF308 domain-containing protein [Candidatus Limnocylindrales bacterium]|jgi:uncharacterized membrane protein HdeD (DUF308 family)